MGDIRYTSQDREDRKMMFDQREYPAKRVSRKISIISLFTYVALWENGYKKQRIDSNKNPHTAFWKVYEIRRSL